MPKLTPSYYQELSKENTSAINCFFDVVWGEDGRVWFNPCYNANLILTSHLVQFDGYELTPVNLENQPQLLRTGSMLCGMTRDGKMLGYTMGGKEDYVFTIDPDTWEGKYYDLSNISIKNLNIRNVIQGQDGTMFALVSGKQSLHLLSITNNDIVQLTEVDLGRPISYTSVARKLLLYETDAGIWFMDDLLPLFLYKPHSKTTRQYTADSFLPSAPKRTSDKVIKGIGRKTKILTYRDELLLFLPQYKPFLFSIDKEREEIRVWKYFPPDWAGYDLYQDKAGNLLTISITDENRYQASLTDTTGRQFEYSSFLKNEKNDISGIAGDNFFQHVFILSKSGLFSTGVKRLDGVHSMVLPNPRGIAGALFTNQFIAYHKIKESVIIHPDGYMEPNTPEAIPEAACFLDMLRTTSSLIRNIIIDDTGIHWFNHSEGVGAYDPSSGKCEIYPVDSRVVRLAELDKHTLIGLPPKGEPFLFNKKNKQATRIPWDLSEQGFVTHLHASPDSMLWISTSTGLWKMDLPNKQSEIIGFDDDFSDFRFQAIEEDRQGRLWLGTATRGLQIYDRHSGTVKVINQKQGLAGNAVMCLVQDDEDIMWVGTRNGLSLVSPKGDIMTNVTREDGLPDNQFSLYGAKKAPNGKLLFQTESGLTLIDPKPLKEQLLAYEKPNKIFLTSLSYFDRQEKREISRKDAIRPGESIQLSPTHRYLKIGMGISNYVNPKGNVYAYKLEGIDEEWIPVGAQHELNLSRLPAGKYRLLLKGADYRNNWTPEPLAIPIHARDFFYKRPWFYTLILGLISLLAFFWIRRLRFEKVRLETEVHRRTRQIRQDKEVIEQQARELRQLDEVKSRFFANVSHELRTPLTLIMGPVRNLLGTGKLQDREHRLAKLIGNNARTLQKRIDQILDLTKLESNKLELEEKTTEVQSLTRRMIALFESNAAQKGINITLDLETNRQVFTLIDTKKLETILENYLSNALKYTPRGGDILVSLELENEWLQWSVRDAGRGIPPAETERVFERYYQVSQSEKTTEGGTGIGLALCRELAELMGGKVWAESPAPDSEGKGSVFYLSVPYHPTKAVEIPKESEAVVLPLIEQPRQAGDQGTILLVEDNPDLRAYIGELLANYQLITAENGQEALDLLEKKNVDLIISDVMMPVMDGFELLKRLKEHSQYQRIPVIMLTARAALEDKLEALRIGVDDYMLKPFIEEELLSRVANAFRRLQNREPLEEEPGNEVIHPRQKWLQEVEAIVLRELSNSRFNLDQLADELFISKRQFQRRIKSYTGMSSSDYIREIRLHQAHLYLESGNYQTVGEVCYAIGLEHQHHFSTLYTDRFGKKPVDYLS